MVYDNFSPLESLEKDIPTVCVLESRLSSINKCAIIARGSERCSASSLIWDET